MKTKLILLLIAALPITALAQQEYFITGKVKNITYPAKVYLYYNINGRLGKDSAAVDNGVFQLKGKVGQITRAFVILKQRGETLNQSPAPDQIGVYLESGKISIQSPDSLLHAKISGTQLNKDQQSLVEVLSAFRKEETLLNTAYKNAEGNDELQVKLRRQFDELASKKEDAQVAFVKSHGNSLVSLDLIRSKYNPKTDPPKSRMLIGFLSKELQSSAFAQRFLEAIGTITPVKIGSLAPDFSMKNANDEMKSLSAYKGKYVLLDFWASWCVPCRKENPNVVKAYNQYKDKQFTVLGISMDGGTTTKENWLKAIKDDALPYEQLSDLLGNSNAAAILYGVTAIPTNFLIDPAGKVIAINLRGAELSDKLADIFSKTK
ncbi:TlpA disulfide reductase family protein [Pedobacter jeongneungensis]|uniref:TlpA disulfide reductase family protein n=1 Tax=Pedobacter jeongneungensis TaxID=947309 RepID=UPI000468AE1B|nr:TlpA disulfide reductase family protein [Pedobacter jeongneungensis]